MLFYSVYYSKSCSCKTLVIFWSISYFTFDFKTFYIIYKIDGNFYDTYFFPDA